MSTESVGKCYVVLNGSDGLEVARSNLITAIKNIRRGFSTPYCAPHVTAYYLPRLTLEEVEHVSDVVEEGLDLLTGCEIFLNKGLVAARATKYPDLLLEGEASEHLSDFRCFLDDNLPERLRMKCPLNVHTTLAYGRRRTSSLQEDQIRERLDQERWTFTVTGVGVIGKGYEAGFDLDPETRYVDANRVGAVFNAS